MTNITLFFLTEVASTLGMKSSVLVVLCGAMMLLTVLLQETTEMVMELMLLVMLKHVATHCMVLIMMIKPVIDKCMDVKD